MINVVLNAIFNLVSGIPLKIWLIIIGLIILLLVGWYFISERNENIRKIAEEKAEKERLERKTEGLQILVNAANGVAREVEKLKETANAQQANSKTANSNFNATVQRDSNSYSNDFSDAKRKYCAEFANDSACS